MKIFQLFLGFFVAMYKLTNGRFGGHIAGLDVLVLSTTGRKTGKQRERPVGYFEHEGAYVVIGSNGGADKDPAWFLNLRANPKAHVRMGNRQLDVTATIADPELRNKLWSQLTKIAPAYKRYETSTQRTIPMAMLRPTAS